MLGSHLSIAGSMTHALDDALRLEFDCVQVFTKNQRQWKVKPLEDAERDAWLARQRELGWSPDPAKGRRSRTVSHNSYLINLGSPDPELRRKSIDLQREELSRCEALEISVCVAHPGAHLGTPRPKCAAGKDLRTEPSPDELAGMRRIAESLDEIHRNLAGYRTITLLETTVGSGTNLGYSFGQLDRIRSMVREPNRVGFCLDTCHVMAAGYDMSTSSSAKAVFEEFDQICGLDRLLAIHLNDSKGAVGSRLDRHEHIGKGCCGLACFEVIMNHPALADVPKILETPKEDAPDGLPWDTHNARRLRAMIEMIEMSKKTAKLEKAAGPTKSAGTRRPTPRGAATSKRSKR